MSITSTTFITFHKGLWAKVLNKTQTSKSWVLSTQILETTGCCFYFFYECLYNLWKTSWTSSFESLINSIYKLEVNFPSNLKEDENFELDVIEWKLSYIKKILGNDWTLWLSIAGILPCTILIPGLFFIPESPRWLVIYLFLKLVLLINACIISHPWVAQVVGANLCVWARGNQTVI